VENGPFPVRPRILLVDDDRSFRELVRTLLDPADYDVVEADSGGAALAAADEGEFDLVVLDVQLPGISGYEVCRTLTARPKPPPAILFVSGARREPLDRVAGLLIGADDYLIKPFAHDELIARVRSLLRRRTPPTAREAFHLTKREGEILDLIASGLRPAEIAARLVISPSTVATHVEHIYGKLGASNRAQALAAAHRYALLALAVLPVLQ